MNLIFKTGIKIPEKKTQGDAEVVKFTNGYIEQSRQTLWLECHCKKRKMTCNLQVIVMLHLSADHSGVHGRGIWATDLRARAMVKNKLCKTIGNNPLHMLLSLRKAIVEHPVVPDNTG